MSYNREKQINRGVIAIIAYILSIILDFVLAFALKDKSAMHRWLWLPLISAAIPIVYSTISLFVWGSGIFSTIREETPGLVTVLGVLAFGGGIIRGLIVTVAYFKASSGFAILGAIFLCLFMLAFNATPLIVVGCSIMDYSGNSTNESSIPQTYSNPTPNQSVDSRAKNVEVNSRPKQGNLTNYFHSYHIPQSGSMYFWHSSPSMTSSFGSHSNYLITGTIGIKAQSVEAFHVTSTDLSHHLASVESDIKRYAAEIIREYRRDYPNDDTDFNIDIELNIIIVD